MAKIQIQSLVLTNWQDPTVVELRIFCNHGFTASTGDYVPQGNYQSGINYISLICTYNAGLHTLTIPQFIINSTVDGIDFQHARYDAEFFNTSGQRVKSFERFANFTVPSIIASLSGCTPTGGATSCGTWADIEFFNTGSPGLFVDGYYTKLQVDAKLQANSGIVNGHVLGAGTPSVVLTGGGSQTGTYGTGASVVIQGSDTSGVVSLTTGTAPGVNALPKGVFVVTFGIPYSSQPAVVVTPKITSLNPNLPHPKIQIESTQPLVSWQLYIEGFQQFAASSSYQWAYIVL